MQNFMTTLLKKYSLGYTVQKILQKNIQKKLSSAFITEVHYEHGSGPRSVSPLKV
jgi:hypothetical protein